MFPSSSVSKDKQELINHARNAREIRQHEKCKSDAAVKIQKVLRSWLTRRRLYRQTSLEFDALFKEDIKSILAVEAYKTARQFLRFCDQKKDEERFQTYCRYLVSSLEQDSPKISCIGVALGKEFALSWISHIKLVLEICLQHLEQINLETSHDAKPMTLYLHTLVSFTATNTWGIVNSGKLPEALKNGMQQICNNIMGHLVTKNYYAVMKTLLIRGLCRQRSHLKHAAVSAVLTLCLRPVIAADFSSRLISLFVLHILSVPSLLTQLQNIAPEIITLFKKHGLLQRVLDFLTVDQNIKIVFHTLEAGLAICLLANVIHLAKLEDEETLKSLVNPQLVCVVQRLLEHCQRYVASKQSNLTQWHPILGWFSCAEKSDVLAATREVIPLVKQQLALLWTGPLISYLFECLPADEEPFPENLEDKNLVSVFKRALGSQKQTVPKPQSRSYRNLGSPEVTQVAFVCTAYQTSLTTLSQMRMDILTALSCRTGILPNLWYFISSLGPNCGLKTFIEFLNVDSKAATPECKMLQMFCEISTHLVTVLDDIEMYEDQRPFKLADLLSITNFLNHFIFRAIWNGLIDLETLNSSSVLNPGTSNLYAAAHTLLMVLHRRDCRRPFATPDHWLVKDVKTSVVMTELDRGKKNAQLLLQKMPHVIPLEERVVLFRRYITNEKKSLGLTESASASPQSILITVHRSRVVEDSFRQLADLPPLIWKGIIRIKFVNIQGLDEAGIDQDGVFKEFLEETIQRLFDPSLNLFRTTKDQRLYPSPTSYLTDNHLMLFEFAGKLLGKAVYEGITVDVPLASFFLSQVLGHCHSALYSAIDELPSLDPELYRNLTYIKRHNGDVSELSLTFSVDDDCMGHLETHELRPGGRAIPVTSENKISYIHEMAHFRMHTQIRDQTAAFSRGFRSLINLEWLSLFSTPEVQRLIADDKGPIDVKDLRRNTKYYGGFHDNHRVISWLWDILESDFNEEERKLFLKFVTSCSKPPLLGFAHLQPPFSIRCVEVGDDEDHGDTIGSVIRGFFTIRKRDPVNRLPTSSTCFNLLKLPNYQKRSTLKEKLRYAITSNTGFELS